MWHDVACRTGDEARRGPISRFEILRSFSRKNRLLMRTLLAMVLVCSILLSALSAFLYTAYSRTGREDVYAVSKTMLEQAYRSADRQLMAIYGYFASLYGKDSQVFEALYAPEFDPVTMFEIGRKIRTWVEVNPLVESIYIYNLGSNTVFSSKTSAQRLPDFFDVDMTARLSDPATAAYPIFIPRSTRYRIYERWEEPRLVSIVFAAPPGPAGLESALVVNIDRAKLLDTLSMDLPSQAGGMMVVDRSGQVVIHPEEEALGRDLSGEDYFERIRDAEMDNGWFTARIGGKRHYVSFFRSSPGLGWYFVSLLDYDRLVAGISKIRNIVFLSTGFSILLAGLASFLLSRTIYRPFNEFLQRVREKAGPAADQEAQGELDFLTRVFDGLAADVSELMGRLDATESIRRREGFQRILRGESFSDSDVTSFGFAGGSYIACACRLDAYQSLAERCSAREVAMIRVAIADLAAELPGQDRVVEAFDAADDTVCILFGSRSPIVDELDTVALMERLRDSVKTLLDLSVSIGIGGPVAGIDRIPSSWQQALDAAGRRFVDGTGMVHPHREDGPKEEGSYPTPLERMILDSLKLEEGSAYAAALERFLGELRELPQDRIKLFIAQLAMALRRTLTEGFRMQGESLGLSWRDIGARLTAFDTIDQAKDWLLEVGEGALAILARKRDGKREEVVERVLRLVKDTYADPNLSVDRLAAEVGLSVNHLRLVFKESTGESVSDLVSRVRFDHAKRLLRSTDLPAKRVAEMVGYTNHNYFYINFKKATGFSPETWRKNPPGEG